MDGAFYKHNGLGAPTPLPPSAPVHSGGDASAAEPGTARVGGKEPVGAQEEGDGQQQTRLPKESSPLQQGGLARQRKVRSGPSR